MTTDPDCEARWKTIRDKCCQPGWLDHIQPKGDVKDEKIASLRAELKEAVEIIRTVFPNDWFINASAAIKDRADTFLSRHQETPE